MTGPDRHPGPGPAVGPDPSAHAPARRRVRRAAVALVAAVLALPAVTAPLLVAPPQDPPGTADVAVVLGPPQPWRVEWALELAADGRAGALLVFVDDPAEVPVCVGDTEVPVVCRRPDPFTTRGEARGLRAEMQARGWRTATVITAAPNVVRARWLVGRCVEEGVQVVGRREDIGLDRWVMRYAWQVGGYAKAALDPGC
ncbi:hypothetical protein [Cellulomonas sp.]|uniref:hypothetical protein n=1 Tax=Cellulomonas sp. TaxID=40001 RepID=UPI002810D427|nr:hypothetical protein [Cellulomonas sp.]